VIIEKHYSSRPEDQEYIIKAFLLLMDLLYASGKKDYSPD